MTGSDKSPKDPTEKLVQAAVELKESITDAKAKLLLALEAARAAFDRRLAELKSQGVDFNE
jgi:hypothetical protein